MTKKRIGTSIICLILLIVSMFALSACGREVNNYNLSFKVDSEVYQTITTTGNESITIPENPTKTGYEFDGWFWDKDVWSRPFTANSLLDAPISSDMSVYAKFNAIEYDITYNDDGGTHDNPLSYTIEDNITLSDAEKTGYSFVGWYKESDFQTEITNIVEGTIGDLELYASFSINQYSITFDSDGGSAVSTISQNYNTVVSKPQEPIKAGCEFLGWFEENSQTEYIFDKIEARNVELKAKWQTQSYNIVYNLDDGTNGNNPTTYTVEDEITLLTASKTGYEFIGWFTDSAYNNEVSTIAIGTTGDIELWAKFEIENYAINYHFDNEKGQMPAPANATSYTIFDEVVLAELTNIKTGYMFNGWFDAETGGNEISKIAVGTTGVKEIYARFSLIDYKIILNNTKNVSANIPTTYTVEDANIALGNISKDGYTFNGWFTQEDGGEQLTQIVTTNAQDIDLYAEWSIIDYTATFKADGNQVGEVLTFNIENMNVIEPSVPEKTGYTGAWEEYTLTLNDIIINAEYDAIVYKITYNVVGEYGIEEVVNNNVTTYTVESEDIVLLNPTTKGFKFIKWTYNSSDISVIEKGSVGDMLINAVWEEELYTITFNSNGGNAISSITKKYGEEISEPLSPTKDEYCFMGWFTEVALINKFEFITMPAEDLTLYAKWEKYSLTISYNENIQGVSSLEEINAEYLDAKCFDNFNNCFEINIQIYGSVVAGNSVSIKMTAENNGYSATKTITNIKVYGEPSLNYNDDVTYFNITDGLTPEWFNASGIDTYEQPTEIELTIEGEYEAGDIVDVIITSIDKAGNRKAGVVSNVKVYGQPIIEYNKEKVNISINDEINAGLFNATAEDSFGNNLEVIVKREYSDKDFIFGNEYSYTTSTAYNYMNFSPLKSGEVKLHFKNHSANKRTYIMVYCNSTSKVVKTNTYYTNNSYSSLSFNVEEGYDYYVRTYAYSNSYVTLFSMYLESGSSFSDVEGYKEGCTDVISLSAQDSFSNSSKILLPVTTYEIPQIFEASRNEFSEEDKDDITPLTMGVVAQDCFGNYLVVSMFIEEGNYSIGEITKILVSATDAAGNNVQKIVEVKIFGMPIVTYKIDGLKSTDDFSNIRELINANARDSFGKELIVTAKVAEGYENVEMVAGSKIKFELTAKDHLGNVATILTEEISIYSVNDITLDYETNVDLIKLNSKGEEFNARAKDTFGEDCDIVIEAAEGFELKAGETIDLYIVAIDKAGNKKYSNLIQGIDVYDIPTLESTLVGNSISASDTEIIKYYKVYDSMGVELPLNEDNFKVIGEHKFNNKLFVKINVEDIAGNVLEKDIELFVYYNNYLFEKNANGYTLLSYKGNDDSINLSEFNVDGFFVTAIDDGAFENRSLLKSVFIPSTVEEIGQKIFFGCSNLEDLTIPFVGRGKNAEEKESLFGYFFGTNYYSNSTKISQYYSDKYVQYYIPNKLVSVNILGGEIKRGAFYGCSNIKNLTIGENVTSIGMYSFYNCLGIEKIVYNAISASDLTNNNYTFYCAGSNKNGISIICGENVEKFPAYLFYPVDDKPEFSPKITVINIGKNVAKIGNKAFYNTKYLEILNFNAINMNDFGSASLPFYTRSGSEGFTLNIGEEVTKIPNNIFYGWNGNSWTQSMVAKIIFEDNSQCLSIGSNAFSGNDKLLSINFGKNASLKSIGIKAFQYCDLLEEVNLPNTLETIGSSAFESCRALKIVSLGENLSSLGDSAFKNCSSINKLFYNTNVLRSLGSSNTIFSCAGNKMELVIGDNVTSLPNYLFYSGGYNNEYPVDNDRRPSIAKIYFSNKIKTINDYVFYSGVTDLEEIHFAGSVDDWCKLNMKYNMFSSGGKLYLNGTLLTNVEISNDITEIRNYAFASLKDIKTVHIGNNVAKIGANAFGGCENITSITFANDSILKSIDSYAFINCKSLKSIAIPNSVEQIGEKIFYNCSSLESLSIPFVGAYDYTLQNYSKSPRYTIGYLFNNYSAEGFYQVEHYYESEYSQSTGLWSHQHAYYYIPNSLKHVTVNRGQIPENAFKDCTSLLTATLESGVKGVNIGAFSNSGITDVYFPNRTEGCWCTDLNMYRPQTVTITEEDLLNSKTAALYMRETYKNYKFVLD